MKCKYFLCSLILSIILIIVMSSITFADSPLCKATGSHSWNAATCYQPKTCKRVGCGATSGKALGHNYGSWKTTKEPTCTSTGTRRKTCTRCSSFKSESIAKKSHSYTSWATTKVETCLATGSKKRTCTVCKYEDTSTIAKLDHKYTKKVSSSYEKSSSPKETYCGMITTVYKCEYGCGKTREVTTADTTHNYVYTFTSKSHTRKCSDCGYTIESNVEHVFSGGKCVCSYKESCKHPNMTEVTLAVATCTKEGSKKSVCSACGYETNATPVSRIAHKESSTWTYESAYHYKLCTMCKQKISSTMASHTIGSDGKCKCGYKNSSGGTTTACKHPNMREVITVEATCTKAGSKKSVCSACGYETNATTVSRIAHKESSTWTYESAYHYKLCTMCKQKISSTLASHTIGSDGKCKCGYKNSSGGTTTACKHPNMREVITVEATCTKEGSKKSVCSTCGYETKATTIAKVNHKESSTWTYESAYHYKLCTMCKQKMSATIASHTIGSDGKCKCGYKNSSGGTTTACKHPNMREVITIEATCSREGKKKSVCSACGYETSLITIPKIDHVYMWVKGETEHYQRCAFNNSCPIIKRDVHKFNDENECTICGYKPKCFHNNIVPATCKEYKKCADCKKILGEKLPHNYGTAYIQDGDKHYQVCQECGDKSKKEKHDIKEFAIIKTATCMNEGEQKGTCLLCKCEVIEKLDKEKHAYSKEAGFSSDYKGHYSHCKWCDAVNPKYEEHKGMTNGSQCTVCGYVCKNHIYEFKNNDNICKVCGYKYLNAKDNECKHEYNMLRDMYGHYRTCSKCGHKDMYTKGAVDNKKYGAHTYGEALDLCNGKHMRVCKYCDYKLITKHAYGNKIYGTGEEFLYKVCPTCKAQNPIGIQESNMISYEFDVNSKELAKKLQQKLFDLGYKEVGTVDGAIGNNTLKALNELLKNMGSSRVLKNKSEITNEIYTLLMNCKETKNQSIERIEGKTFDNYYEKIKKGTATDIERIIACQIALKRAGYYNGESNGKSTIDLENAIRTFFELRGRDFNGYKVEDLTLEMIMTILNNRETLVARMENFIEDLVDGTQKFDLANNKTQCKLIEDTLNRLGYKAGKADGEFSKDTVKAFNHLCQDLGIIGPDGNTFIIKNVEELKNIPIDLFKTTLTTEQKGLSKIEIPKGATLIETIIALDNYTSSHGFKYAQLDIPASPDETTIRTNFDGEGGLYTPGEYYAIDCAEAVTSAIYLYAKANGNEEMADYFDKCVDGDGMGSYAGAYGENKYLEKVDPKDARPGDILVYDKHVEFLAQNGHGNGYPLVYNWGNSEHIMHAGEPDLQNKRNPANVKYILRVKE